MLTAAFVKFLITVGVIGTFGPGHVEGGFEAIKDKGVKSALENAWDERESYDSGHLKNTLTGNFGND